MIYSNLNELKKVLPRKGRFLGIDVGTKKIGVAICDDLQKIATPKTIIVRKSNLKDFNNLLSIIQENHIKAIIIGFPIKMDGSTNLISDFVMRFAINFDKFLADMRIDNLVLAIFDERLSSFMARQNFKNRRDKNDNYDDISASLILENFLNCLSEGED
jgi:putative Holliday junction resolvase